MGILYILLGSAFGAIITYLRMENKPLVESEELTSLKSTNRFLEKKIKSGEMNHERLEAELKSTQEVFEQQENRIKRLNEELFAIKARLESLANKNLVAEPMSQSETVIMDRTTEIQDLAQQVKTLTQEKSELASDIARLEEANLRVAGKTARLEEDLNQKVIECSELKRSLSSEKKAHKASQQTLEEHRISLVTLGEKFNSDFENIGTKILDELESQYKTKH